jgi:hypothetical protein
MGDYNVGAAYLRQAKTLQPIDTYTYFLTDLTSSIFIHRHYKESTFSFIVTNNYASFIAS